MTQAFYYVNVVIPIGAKDFTFKVCGKEFLDSDEFELTRLSCHLFPASTMLADPHICCYIKNCLRSIKRTKGSLVSLDKGLVSRIK